MANRISWDRMAGLLSVLLLHAAALYGLWSYRMLPSPAQAVTVFVNLINPPPAAIERPRPELPKPPLQPEKPQPPRAVEPVQQLVVEAPVVSPPEPVAPAAPRSPPAQIAAAPVAPQPVAPAVPAPPAPSPARPAAPVTLAEELSVTCPNRIPPAYPPYSRRIGEQGRVVLRVELDERGGVAQVSIATSSGSSRLDEAALAAVRLWRCNPALRNGAPMRAVALQPFNFILEGR